MKIEGTMLVEVEEFDCIFVDTLVGDDGAAFGSSSSLSSSAVFELDGRAAFRDVADETNTSFAFIGDEDELF
jgi:hypothetical protein